MVISDILFIFVSRLGIVPTTTKILKVMAELNNKVFEFGKKIAYIFEATNDQNGEKESMMVRSYSPYDKNRYLYPQLWQKNPFSGRLFAPQLGDEIYKMTYNVIDKNGQTIKQESDFCLDFPEFRPDNDRGSHGECYELVGDPEKYHITKVIAEKTEFFPASFFGKTTEELRQKSWAIVNTNYKLVNTAKYVGTPWKQIGRCRFLQLIKASDVCADMYSRYDMPTHVYCMFSRRDALNCMYAEDED